MLKLKKIWNNDYVKTAAAIGLIVALVLGLFLGLRLVLNTSVPIRVVESGSMCVPYGQACDGFLSLTHPFDQTLHKGDILIIQGVKPEEFNGNYPNSDIIVYENPRDPTGTPIVHRIVAIENISGTLYFQTKGDGNGYTKYPEVPSEDEWDSHTLWTSGQGVSQDAVEGRVVTRIPWFGWIALIMQQSSWGLPLVIGLIVLLVVVEFVIPILKEKRKPAEKKDMPKLA